MRRRFEVRAGRGVRCVGRWSSGIEAARISRTLSPFETCLSLCDELTGAVDAGARPSGAGIALLLGSVRGRPADVVNLWSWRNRLLALVKLLL